MWKATLVFVVVLSVAGAQVVHDLSAPYTRQTNWEAFGSAKITTDGVVLTHHPGPVGVAQRGAIWDQTPLAFSQGTWEVQLDFRALGEDNGGGEGLALWLTETKNEIGPVFGSRDKFKGLAIVFDSHDNDNLRNNPSVSAHVFDGTRQYNHADDGLGTQLAGCIADFRNRADVVSSRVSFNGTVLGVYLDLSGQGKYRKCLEANVNLQMGPVHLGVSAETLGSAANQEMHEVVGIRVTGTTDPIPGHVRQMAIDEEQRRQQVGYSYGSKPPAPVSAAPQNKVPEVAVPKPTGDVKAPAAVTGRPGHAVHHFEGHTMVHEKLDKLLAANALESSSTAEALREVEENLRVHVTDAVNAVIDQVGDPSAVADQVAALATHLQELADVADAIRRQNVDLDARIQRVAGDLMAVQEAVQAVPQRVVTENVRTSDGMTAIVWVMMVVFAAVSFVVGRVSSARQYHPSKYL
ncbi:L-type lectin-like domain-containing protein [Plasmodiophora brassicae]